MPNRCFAMLDRTVNDLPTFSKLASDLPIPPFQLLRGSSGTASRGKKYSIPKTKDTFYANKAYLVP